MKVLGVFCAGLVLFLLAFFWPSLHSDWHYWTKQRQYDRLELGETKSEVKSRWGLPADTLVTDSCWTDSVTRWPGPTRVYTLCFAHGRLTSKTYTDQ